MKLLKRFTRSLLRFALLLLAIPFAVFAAIIGSILHLCWTIWTSLHLAIELFFAGLDPECSSEGDSDV